MEYIQYIEESQTWKCPKTGKWKITCVGGGASGTACCNFRIRYYNSSSSSGSSDVDVNNCILNAAGGASSFGKHISAGGGESISTEILVAKGRYLGQPGYLGYSDYVFMYDNNNNIIMPFHVHGYGAGGSSYNRFINSYNICSVTYGSYSGTLYTYSGGMTPYGGICGEVKICLCDVNENDNIPITVGKGGHISDLDNMIKQTVMSSNKNVSNFNFTPYVTNGQYTNFKTALFNSVSDGNDGVVILQYMGG